MSIGKDWDGRADSNLNGRGLDDYWGLLHGSATTQETHRRPVAAGAAIGFAATLITWFLAIRILEDISTKVSALNLQAATGLLAIIVLLVVMNWFFHRMYWTGWISLHNRRKREILDEEQGEQRQSRVLFGLDLLGFSSLYREGVEVVLFLQSYRLRVGDHIVNYGVLLGLLLTAAVGILTFIAHRKLPYRRMLVWTGIMLGLVLFVMVGEQAQENATRSLVDHYHDHILSWPNPVLDGHVALHLPNN